MSNRTWIDIGYVRSASPAQRQLRVAPLPGKEEVFEALEWVNILPHDTEVPSRCRVAGVAKELNGYILTLNPGVPRDRMAQMKGALLTVESQELADRVPNEGDSLLGHVSEYEGFDVLDLSGSLLGTVSEVYATAMSGAFEIRKPDGTALMAPAIPQVIARVDFERRRLVVNDLEPYVVDSRPEAADADAD